MRAVAREERARGRGGAGEARRERGGKFRKGAAGCAGGREEAARGAAGDDLMLLPLSLLSLALLLNDTTEFSVL